MEKNAADAFKLFRLEAGPAERKTGPARPPEFEDSRSVE